MTTIKKHLFAILFFIAFAVILLYRLFSSFNFHPDFARDIYDMLTIIQGKLTLIGPKLSFGGIYSGPYYYYLLTPVLYMSNLNPNALLLFNAIIFVAGGVAFYVLLPGKTGVPFRILATAVLSMLPFYVTGARGPWNGWTYLPLLLVYFSLIFFVNMEKRLLVLLATGFLGGVIVNIHLVSLPVVLVAALYLALALKDKKWLVIFAAGFFSAFIPLAVFEIKHNFVMFKNTFLVGSYKTFVENNNIPNAVSGKKNILENFGFIVEKLSQQVGIALIFYGAVMAYVFKPADRRGKFLAIASFILVAVFAVALRFQFGGHYLYPVSLFLTFAFVVSLIKTNFRWIALVLLLAEIMSFPKNIYTQSARMASTFEKRVSYVIDHGLIRRGQSFNVIQISKEYGAYIPVGHEYRFFFRKSGFIPKTEFEYSASDTLLVFSEIRNFDLSELDNWEVREYGRDNLAGARKYEDHGTTLYVINKTK